MLYLVGKEKKGWTLTWLRNLSHNWGLSQSKRFLIGDSTFKALKNHLFNLGKKGLVPKFGAWMITTLCSSSPWWMTLGNQLLSAKFVHLTRRRRCKTSLEDILLMPKTVHVCSIESWAPLFALGQHIITLLVCSNIFICLLPSGTIKLNCQDDKCLKKMSSPTVSTPTNEITTEMC